MTLILLSCSLDMMIKFDCFEPSWNEKEDFLMNCGSFSATQVFTMFLNKLLRHLYTKTRRCRL